MRADMQKRWVLPMLLVLGLMCVFAVGTKMGSPASAQIQPMTSSDGRIMVVPVQIGRDSYGVAMVDTIAQTVWIYELNNRGPAPNRLKLLAARSWQYDRMLKRYNTAEPYPEQVKMLIESMAASKMQERQKGRSLLQRVAPERTDSRPGP
jgi:hypothetical protein